LERKALVAVCVILVLVTIGSVVTGASEHQTGDGDEVDSSKATNGSLENVDSALTQLVNASDKEGFAERNGINYRNGRVQVVVELEGGATMPQNHNVTEEVNYTGQGENLVQAYVPVGNITSLSDEPRVSYVRLPTDSESLRGSGENETGGKGNPETDEEGKGEDGDEESESGETQGRETDESETRGEDLSSVMGGVIATVMIILTAAYARRKV